MDLDTVVKKTAAVIEEVFDGVGFESKVIEVRLGPSYIQYVLDVSTQADYKEIASLLNILSSYINPPVDLIIIEAPIPGTKQIGIDVPNELLQPVEFNDMWYRYGKLKKDFKLPVLLGDDVIMKDQVKDLTELENIIIAGSTGSGKSMFNNTLIWSLILSNSPKDLKLFISDVKRVAFGSYNGIPHLMDSVHVDVEDVLKSLDELVDERKKRESLFRKNKVKSFDEYNKKYPDKKLPFIVMVIDTFSDLMMYDSKRFENVMEKLLTNSKDYGMFAVISDSRPSADVFTYNIRKLFPTRIAFNTASAIDSQMILGQLGAEKLLGRGDMLFLPFNLKQPLRLQAPFLSDNEIKKMMKEHFSV